MRISLRPIWQERAQIEVTSHIRSLEGSSVVLVLFCPVLYVYSHVLHLSLINQSILD